MELLVHAFHNNWAIHGLLKLGDEIIKKSRVRVRAKHRNYSLVTIEKLEALRDYEHKDGKRTNERALGINEEVSTGERFWESLVIDVVILDEPHSMCIKKKAVHSQWQNRGDTT